MGQMNHGSIVQMNHEILLRGNKGALTGTCRHATVSKLISEPGVLKQISFISSIKTPKHAVLTT